MEKVILFMLVIFLSLNASSQCDLDISTSREDSTDFNIARIVAFKVKTFPKLILSATKTQSSLDTNTIFTFGISYVSESVGPISKKDSILLALSDDSEIILIPNQEVYGGYLSSSDYGILYTMNLNISISKEQINRIYRFGITHLSLPNGKKSIHIEPKSDLMRKFQVELQCLYNEDFNSE